MKQVLVACCVAFLWMFPAVSDTTLRTSVGPGAACCMATCCGPPASPYMASTPPSMSGRQPQPRPRPRPEPQCRPLPAAAPSRSATCNSPRRAPPFPSRLLEVLYHHPLICYHPFTRVRARARVPARLPLCQGPSVLQPAPPCGWVSSLHTTEGPRAPYIMRSTALIGFPVSRSYGLALCGPLRRRRHRRGCALQLCIVACRASKSGASPPRAHHLYRGFACQ
jgi:hypothetical protein